MENLQKYNYYLSVQIPDPDTTSLARDHLLLQH